MKEGRGEAGVFGGDWGMPFGLTDMPPFPYMIARPTKLGGACGAE